MPNLETLPVPGDEEHRLRAMRALAAGLRPYPVVQAADGTVTQSPDGEAWAIDDLVRTLRGAPSQIDALREALATAAKRFNEAYGKAIEEAEREGGRPVTWVITSDGPRLTFRGS